MTISENNMSEQVNGGIFLHAPAHIAVTAARSIDRKEDSLWKSI